MKPELIERLNQINRKFYSDLAASFSETRPASARELETILPHIADGASVLDIGCGNGRVAAMLARYRREVTYIGVDASQELIARCKMQEASHRLQVAEFVVADITQSNWIDSLSQPRAGEPSKEGRWPGPALSEAERMRVFDCVLMLAVLHHIPGSDVRARIMRQVRELLAPQGRIVISTWQFLDSERMRKKIVPWNVVGIDERELEPGDALLNWKRGGTGLRYCHWIGGDELRLLAAQADLNIVETFRADGRERNLSLYAVVSA
jgi:tRNA (uracil-5-)-methyltransferase TRM9